MCERPVGCVLLMKYKWGLDDVESTSGHLNPKVSGLLLISRPLRTLLTCHLIKFWLFHFAQIFHNLIFNLIFLMAILPSLLYKLSGTLGICLSLSCHKQITGGTC